MIEYEIHEFANCIPKMTEDEFKRLKDDIKGLGVLEPIILLNGKILDGRHRYRACLELSQEKGFEEIECPVREMNNLSPNDIVAAMNVFRRHLTPSQIAMVMEALKEPFLKEAKFRQQTGGGDKKSEKVKSVKPKSGEAISKGKETSEILAEKGGISKGTMQAALTVGKHGTPEEKNAVIDGEISVSRQADQIKKRLPPKTPPKQKFNKSSESERIEWAKWTWNPVTGCKHGCKYCYARDFTKLYPNGFPQGFKPRFIEERLSAPRNTIPPSPAYEGSKNVFVCSMGDLFGDWVPQEWIDKVLISVKENPQWNYIFLTKNPKRYIGIDWPANCWVGATVDCQERVEPTLEAMEQVWMDDEEHNPPIRKPDGLFLSCEPLNGEVIIGDKIHCLDWIIIGGQSTISNLQGKQPKWEWVEQLHWEAKMANCQVYWKPNLEVRPKEYPEKLK